MKKKIFVSIFLCFMLVLGFIPIVKTKTNFSSNVSAFESFEQSVIQEIQDDDYSSIEIEKTTTLSNLKQKMNICEDNSVSALSNQILTKNQLIEYCTSNDYVVQETNDCYQIRNKFSLKRLIVTGNISSSYSASKVISYKDIKFLCFDSEESTKIAYKQLIKNNINVTVDSVVTADSEEVVKAQTYSDTYWNLNAIDLDSYTDYNTTKQIVVTVLDTGINTAHEMFTDRLLYNNGKIVGFSYYESNYSYNDSNLYFDSSNTSKYSFEDDQGHGSHVAGIICQLTPSNVKILPIRILDSSGEGAIGIIITALQRVNNTYSTQYKIACNNLSLGAELQDSNILSQFNTVFSSLMDKNILNIVAAGNNCKDTSVCLPAACDETAIVVSALKHYSTLFSTTYSFDSSYSNYGSSVDISAPGTEIYSAYKASSNLKSSANQYKLLNGTSMATPHVAGCVALLCLDNDYYTTSTSNPTYTASEIQTRLFDATVDNGTTGKDVYYGYGMLCLTDINKKSEMVYSTSNASFTYDGSYHNISISVTKPASYTIKYSLTDNSNYTITNINSNASFKNVTNGSMAVYYQISATGYNTVTGVNYLTINKRNLTYTLENQNSIYGNSSHLDLTKCSLTSGTVVSGDNLNLALTTNATQTSACGTYNINLTYSNSNYNITSNTATLTISQRPITIKINNTSSVYGESFQTSNSNYTISSGTVLSSDDLGIELDYSQLNFNKVGSYTVTIKTYTNSNYLVTATSGTHTVTQRPITIKIENQTSIYGEDVNLDQTAYSITSGDIVNNDNLNITLSITATKTSDAKSYPITATSTNSNYKITFNSAYYIITKRNITISTQNQTFTYGEVSLNQTKYTIDEGSFVSSDASLLSLTSSASSTANVGTYPIYVNLNSNNYNLTQTNGYATIDRRTLKITINIQDVCYGDTLILDNSQYSITYGNIVNDDIVNIGLTANLSATNKNYIVEANSSNSNYMVEILNNQVNVLKRPISIKITQTSTYGSDIDLNADDFIIVSGNIVNNDNLDLILYTTANKFSSVGSYQISLGSANENYDVALVDSFVTISPKLIYASLENQSGMYGDKIILDQTKYNFNTNQLVGEDNINFSLSTTATKDCNVGEYPITATIDNSNYTLDGCYGIYTINKRQITIRLYNQTVQNSFKITFNGEDYDIMSGTVVNNDELNIVLHTNASALSLAGNYDLIATYSNDNYDITFTDAELTVEFSYVDVVIITVPIIVVGLISTFAIWILIKRKKRSANFYKKWMK